MSSRLRTDSCKEHSYCPLLGLWRTKVSVVCHGFASLLLHSIILRGICELGMWTFLNEDISFPPFLSSSSVFRFFAPIPKTVLEQ